MSNEKYVGKYKNYAFNICSDLFNIIDILTDGIHSKDITYIKEMKNYLRMIYMDIDSLVKI
jgi:hypothetical protein